MSAELKPCPFCGGKADDEMQESIFCGEFSYISCRKCGARTDGYLTSELLSDTLPNAWNTRADGWISVENALPELQFESQEDPDEDGYPQFDGMVSQTIEITDGEGFGRGHLRSDGKWICYGAEYDMMIVDPEKVTHWAQLRQLPKASSCGE